MISNLFVALVFVGISFGADYYVATDGLSGNTGAIGSPWNRASVFADGNPKNLQPGDTVHFRGGTYDGQVLGYGNGSAGNWITFQNYAGETVIFDYSSPPAGESAGAIFNFMPTTSYLRLQRNPAGGRFVVTVSNTQRVFSANNVDPEHVDFCYPNCRPDGISDFGDYNEVLNLEIHDVGVAIGSQSGACGSRYQGNIMYYNGWESPTINVGNDFYMQQPSDCVDPKIIKGNIMFGSWQFPQLYGSSGAYVRDMQFTENIHFNPGMLATDSEAGGVLVGGIGTAVVEDNTVADNVLVNTLTNSTRRNMLRFYQRPCINCTVNNNYVRAPASSGGIALQVPFALTGLSETGNVVVGPVSDENAQAQFPNSTFLSAETTDRVYSIGGSGYTRAIAVVDGDGDGSVSWTPTDCGSAPALEIREMMNYTAASPDQTLNCGSGAQTISMAYTGSILSAVGDAPNAAVHTGDDFRVFLVTEAAEPETTTSVLHFTPDTSATCTVNVWDNAAYSGTPVYSATTASGTARRTVTITDVIAGTNYYGKLICGTAGADGIAILKFKAR